MLVELIEHYGTDLTPVNAARVSFANESDWEWSGYEDMNGDWHDVIGLSAKDTKLIHYLAKHKHTSCFEHQGATLRLKVPIFIARQIQRHRTFAYNEVSRRYVDNPPEFYTPEVWRKRADNVKQGSTLEGPSEEEWGYGVETALKNWNSQAVWLYNDMLDAGVAPELARIVLPQSLYTEFYMSGSLRNFAHFLQLRLDAHAQLEVQQVAQQVEALLRPLWPVSMNALMKETSNG